MAEWPGKIQQPRSFSDIGSLEFWTLVRVSDLGFPLFFAPFPANFASLIPMSPLLFGFGVGVLITVPLAMVAARRTALRVRRLERRALSAERLAELGTLTGGLAHEIKNPLSTINLNVQLLQEDLTEIAKQVPADSPIIDRFGRTRRRIEALSREIQRLRDILEDFLRFAGRVKLDLAPTNINHVMGELADFFAPQAQAAGVQLRAQLAANPATVPADGALLKQALLNLLINAVHAMTEARQAGTPHGGCNELILRTRVRYARWARTKSTST